MYYSSSLEQTVSRFMYKVYGWMSLGLAVTAGIAYAVSTSPQVMLAIHKNPWLLFGLFIVQFGLVLVMSLLIFRMDFATALGCFLLYAGTLGLTLAPIFVIYTAGSIYLTFLVTAGMFGTMALYGYFTQTDLTAMRSFLMMALIGLMIAMVVNIFLKSQTMDYVLSAVGVVIFTLLTAYDVQKIKQLAQQLLADDQMRNKVALLGALTLYLDFINLFLFLLRFLGKPREE